MPNLFVRQITNLTHGESLHSLFFLYEAPSKLFIRQNGEKSSSLHFFKKKGTKK